MFNFDELLILFSGLLLLVVVFSFINEKTIKLPYEIGLVVFGFAFTVMVICGRTMNVVQIPEEFYNLYREFNFNDFLFHGVLCFMLFSGASRIKFSDFSKDKYLIGSMAIASTIVSTMIYGLLLWGLGFIIHVNISLFKALILGSIVAPTDPISAMSILAKAGLSKRLGLIIEGEALFNDGVAVAIFATLISILKHTSGDISIISFIIELSAEVLGAALIGFVISFLFFEIFKRSKDPYIKIFSSILTVMIAYLICNYLGFSGPIAAVICGLHYATGISRIQKQNRCELIHEVRELFYSFWSVIDSLLNGMLFLLVGLLFISIRNFNTLPITMIIIIGSGAIFFNTVSRMAGVSTALLFTRNLPDGMKRMKLAAFLTWGGLKGGLCLALIMGTNNVLSSQIYNLFLVSTYAIVLFTTVFQGLTVGKAYKMLNNKKEFRLADKSLKKPLFATADRADR
ncbi:cation:proton antiporter [Acetobacterium carbinolicum]|uniref:cation:proton antiporter n=1 Tax=Acetobacterium carbinolicum TaxID=52690 RepID=UPI0039BF3448